MKPRDTSPGSESALPVEDPTPDRTPAPEAAARSPQDCPVYKYGRRLVELTEDMLETLRNFNAELTACEACPYLGGCLARRYFDHQVQTALEELAEEWNLTLVHKRS